MATRAYSTAVGAATPPVSPAFGSAWGVTTNATRGVLTPTKTNSGLGSVSAANFLETSTSAVNVLMHQIVSDPLAAQTISGTFSAVFRGGETSSAADAYLQIVLRVVSNDGATERAVLYAGAAVAVNSTANAIGQEFTGSSLTRIYPAGTAISSYTCVAGDRLVAEIGQRYANTTATAQSGYLAFGDNTGTADHTLAAGTTTLLVPWIELSHDITWDTGATDYPRSTGDTAAATDTPARGMVTARAEAETAAAADGCVAMVTQGRAASDVATAGDTTARGAQDLTRPTTDTAPATDAATRATVAARGLADTAGATDTTAPISTASRAITDTAAAGDATSGTATGDVARATSDAAAAGDAAAPTSTASRATSDTAAATDTTARGIGQSRTLGDPATVLDLAAAALTQARALLDQALAADATAGSSFHPTPGPTGRILVARVGLPYAAGLVGTPQARGRVTTPTIAATVTIRTAHGQVALADTQGDVT